ncbi:MAG: hypothetical protein SXV54_02995 [Chloroflexota bacterium]|nr:hypothetical protein [Chloroflexota bacterium]
MRTWHILVTITMFGLMLTLTACGEKPLLSQVSFNKEVITPNADGDADVLVIAYNLSRSADVSIYFESKEQDQAGNRYYFRDHIHHPPSVEDPYQVHFAGVVDGYVLSDGEFEGFTVEKRVLQDGDYTWTVEATDEQNVTEQASGTLTIAAADTAIPELGGFSVYPQVFSPNRDSIADRVTINVDLKKDVDELTVYLEGEDGVRYHVMEKETVTELNEAGWHEFDYDAGVDHGADPPPDGTYTVTMRARDAVGQWTETASTLTIEEGGVPRAYILNGEVDWSGRGPEVSIPLSDTLYFTLTIENDSVVPIRTSGPPPGTVYDSKQNYATLGQYEQSGAFRVALHCETSPTDHPWRWAIGGPGDLETRVIGGEEYRYLPAGGRALVTGGIRFVDYVEARNPQYCYASLIHEDVEISMVNYRVDPVQLKIQVP